MIKKKPLIPFKLRSLIQDENQKKRLSFPKAFVARTGVEPVTSGL
jgi:hypothetical protein